MLNLDSKPTNTYGTRYLPYLPYLPTRYRHLPTVGRYRYPVPVPTWYRYLIPGTVGTGKGKKGSRHNYFWFSLETNFTLKVSHRLDLGNSDPILTCDFTLIFAVTFFSKKNKSQVCFLLFLFFFVFFLFFCTVLKKMKRMELNYKITG